MNWRSAKPWVYPFLAWLFAILVWGLVVPRACSAQERPASYVVIQSAFVASAAFDLASTLYYYPQCRPSCSEQNSLLGPALEHSPVAAVLVGATLTAATVWAADRVWAHEKIGRHLWWIIPVAGTVNHVLAARANMELMR